MACELIVFGVNLTQRLAKRLRTDLFVRQPFRREFFGCRIPDFDQPFDSQAGRFAWDFGPAGLCGLAGYKFPVL